MSQLKEPEGIPFFSIKTGETMFGRLEPTIAAFINSSDMGINASRGQDYGWRLAPEWVKKIRAFRADEDKMEALAAKLRLEDGVAPNTTQILYYIYGRQVRTYLQRLQEEENPFEDQYQRDISGAPSQSNKPEKMSTHLQAAMDDDEITETVDEADLMPAEEGDDDGDSSQATDSTPSATEPVQEVDAASNSNKPADKKPKKGPKK